MQNTISIYALPGLKTKVPLPIKPLTPEHILNTVCNYFGITIEQLTDPIKPKEISEPRHIAKWLLRNNTKLSLKKIGSQFSACRGSKKEGQDHTSVIASLRKVNDWRDTNDIMYLHLQEIINNHL